MTNADETSGRAYPKDKRETFKISTYKQFCYNKNLPGKVVVKPFIDGFVSSTFTLLTTHSPTYKDLISFVKGE